MNNFFKKSLLAIPMMFITSTSYAELTTNVLITSVGGDARNNSLVSIELSKEIKNGVCERNNVLYLDPASEQQQAWIAVAMIAKVNKTPVVLIDSGTCNETFNGSTVGNVVLIKG